MISINQNSNNIHNYTIHQFLNSNNYFFEEKDVLNPEYFSINNKIIFENNENDWKQLMEEMEKIKNEISSSKAEKLDEKKISLIKLIFEKTEDKFIQEIIYFKANERIIAIYNLIYYLLDLKENSGKDVSKVIISLYKKLITEKQIYIDLKDNEITCVDKENIEKNIHLLSKLSFQFNNIKIIKINKCKVKDFSLAHLEALFSSSLTELFLNNNKIIDLSVFNNRQIYSNLIVLDLSNNNIEDLTPLSKIKFHNLKELNLIGNELNSGIEQFTSNIIKNTSEQIILEMKKKDNLAELFFDYSKNFELKFKYIIKYKNFNEVLKHISFKGIKYMNLKGFDNDDIRFLSNDTLESLEILDLISTNITDLSIFDDINFINIKKINIYCSDDKDILPITPIIEKNLNSLSAFK